MLYSKKLSLHYLLLFLFLVFFTTSIFGQKATIIEEEKVMKTYPFSDPNPIPSLTSRSDIFPYHRFDGYSHTAKDQKWKVVTLENDYIKVFVFPEIGGKVWGAIEKSTGEEFLYYNDVVKFRNISMRGPWTSGGIEFNFGIVGHTPATATPVDYIIQENIDGSVSCTVGALDLPSRTQWRVKIYLPADKAYFETQVLWYNPSPIHHSYYNWMTAAARVSDDLEFFYPGHLALEHSGGAVSWPIDSAGNKLSIYKNNNFGDSKSLHVAGSYNNYFGGYFHDKKFGFGHWARFDEMPGKKLWLWALSRQGGIWEDLLTDNDGQYMEFQAGRLMNQLSRNSNKYPITEVAFAPYTSDLWTDVWYPFKETGGISSFSTLGAINVEKNGNSLNIHFNALQKISGDLVVKTGDKEVFKEKLSMAPMEVITKQITIASGEDKIEISIGSQQVFISAKVDPFKLDRPYKKEKSAPLSPVEQLNADARENYITRNYTKARELYEKCLELDPGHQEARTGLAELLYRNGKYSEALAQVNQVLEHDFYDYSANYIAGISYKALDQPVNALEALGWAGRSMEYRSAAYAHMAEIAFQMGNQDNAGSYAQTALNFNRFNISAHQVLAVLNRKSGNVTAANEALNTILELDPLSHFTRFEKYLLSNKPEDLKQFSSLINNEMPYQSYLEIAMEYLKLKQNEDAIAVLDQGPDHPLNLIWLAYLNQSDPAKSDKYLASTLQKSPEFVFPYRSETLPVLEWATQKKNSWKLKYFLALNKWAKEDKKEAAQLFKAIGNDPDYAPFYLTRANILQNTENADPLNDLNKALALDQNQWRTWHMLNNYLDKKQNYQKQLTTTEKAYKKFKNNYVIGMDYAQALLNNKKYDQSISLLNKLQVLPYEGAGEGRSIYEQAYLLSALEDIRKGNFKQAISKINTSLEWPENLGVGKPYDSDTRRQNYLLAYAYAKQHTSAEAAKYMKGVVKFSKEHSQRNSFNNLLGLLAIKKQGNEKEIQELISSIKNSGLRPANQWVINYWENSAEIKDGAEKFPGNKDFLLFNNLLEKTSDFK
ncbi:DUF5107 domain-containing protein [soil metagenome]